MLTEKVVVIQAGKNSGALYTAKCGMEYNKEVFAVPNSIYDSFSLGTNDLIFKGAKIYCNSKMIVKSNAINQNSIMDLPKMNEEEIEVRGYKCVALALLICSLYAVLDEVHQAFVPGRGPGAKDVFIDSAGALVGILIYLGIKKKLDWRE